MLEVLFYPSPNCMKVLIALEETELEHRLTRIDIGRGEQFDPAFLAVSPNNKVPALVDHDTGATLFESGAILVYIAERSGSFLPAAEPGRSQVFSWLFWQVGGLGPMAGQAHHFRAFASEEVPYGIRRYTDEVNRLYGVMERRLRTRDYLAGDYSVADMASYPWIVPHERQGQDLGDFPALADWFRRVGDRPAVQRAMARGNEEHVPRERYGHLYGQTAASVRAASDARGEDR